MAIFGYNVIGGTIVTIATGSNLGDASTRRGTAWPMPAGGGTANFIMAYIGGDVVCDCKAFILQKDSGGANIHGLIAVAEVLSCPIGPGWVQFMLAGEVLVGGVDYILAVIGNKADMGADDRYNLYKNNNAAAVSYYENQTYCSEENPWTIPPEATRKDYSIYCDYSPPGWTGKISGVTDPASIMGVDVANIASVKGVA